MALDDVTLTNGLCEDESEPQINRQGVNLIFSFDTCGNLFQSLCVMNICISNEESAINVLLNFTICAPFIFQGNCDFDSNFCFWRNDLFFSFTWTQLRYDTPSWQTGPSADHTSGDVRLYSHA